MILFLTDQKIIYQEATQNKKESNRDMTCILYEPGIKKPGVKALLCPLDMNDKNNKCCEKPKPVKIGNPFVRSINHPVLMFR